ncbi:calcitonin gene-related peptide type 1 receptor-like isoform X2 [Lineus longissimus]|uniref:calcitonin gene-related peptide type 1 receptor-like isoform X2 n=1 Tax=Lineus longissimus TaxID=88925 RepID=UPI002B4DA911
MDYFKNMSSSAGFRTRPMTFVVILVTLFALIKAEGEVVSYNATESIDAVNRTLARPPVEMDTAKKIAEARCVDEILMKPYPTDGRLYCNRTWDGWGCWNDTPAGELAYTACPSFMEGFDPRLKANKICTINGTWWIHPMTGKRWSNYTTCVDRSGMQTDKAVLTVFIAGYSASMIAMVLSLIIFFSFKQLNCDRITLHKNLFISYVLNGLLWILFYTLVAYDPVVLGQNPLWCRVMHIFTSYFTVCNFFWMFNEGLYLHTIIVVAFSSGKKLLIGCHLIGWVLPLIPVTIYTLLRGLSSDEHQKLSCWLHETDLHWINAGPVVASLVLNFIFLCNIIRVLVTKLRAVNSPDTNQTKKAVRATIILVPLLGLQYIIIPFRPAPDSTEERIYLVVAAVLVSFQGLFVAMIFCFFNGEVVALMKRKYGQRRMMRAYNGSRRGTYCTTVTMAPVDSVSHVPTSPNDDSKVPLTKEARL